MATMFIEAAPEGRRQLTPRRGQRSTVSLPALISVFGERHSAQLHNLSAYGAMIQSAAPVSMEDHIVLSCGTVERLGRVAWAKQGCFGVEFHSPIGHDEVDRQVARSQAITMRRHQRLGAESK